MFKRGSIRGGGPVKAAADPPAESTAEAAGSSSQYKGYVTKCGGSVRSWKRRWMVLKDGVLYYYPKENSKTPKGSMTLGPEDSAHAVRNSEKSPFMIGVNTAKRTYLMFPDTAEEQQQWLFHVSAAVAAKNGRTLEKQGSAPVLNRGSSSSTLVSTTSSLQRSNSASLPLVPLPVGGTSPALARVKERSTARSQRSMSLSSVHVVFDSRDRLLFMRETLKWDSEDIEAIAVCFWELWIRHLPKPTGAGSDDEGEQNVLGSSAVSEGASWPLQFSVMMGIDKRYSYWEARCPQQHMLQLVVDYMYAVGAAETEWQEKFPAVGAIIQPSELLLWTEISSSGCIEGGYAMPVQDGSCMGQLCASLKCSALEVWYVDNASRVELRRLWRECSTRAKKCWRLEFAAKASQVESILSTLGFPPTQLVVTTALRAAKGTADASLDVLRLWVFDDGAVGAAEVVLPVVGKLPDMPEAIKAARGPPTHIVHRTVKTSYDPDNLYGAGYTMHYLWERPEQLLEPHHDVLDTE